MPLQLSRNSSATSVQTKAKSSTLQNNKFVARVKNRCMVVYKSFRSLEKKCSCVISNCRTQTETQLLLDSFINIVLKVAFPGWVGVNMQTLTILKFSSLLATLVYLEKTPPPPCPILDLSFKPCANGRNIVGCYMLRPFAHPAACCWMLLRKVGNRSNFSAKNSQHFFCSVIAEA